MTAPSHLNDFLNELTKQISGELRTDIYSRTLYSTDASIYQMMPHGVMIPSHIEDVHAAIELAARHKIALLPRTGGSSLAGQAVNEALVIDFTRHLDQVLEVNQEEQWVRVEPGIVLDELNIYLKQYGLQFGPDPASSNRSCLGGIVSNNSTGAHSILYGMTADHVLEIRGYLSDGSPFHFSPMDQDQLSHALRQSGMQGDIYRQVKTLIDDSANRKTIQAATPRHWRRCGGYNLDRFVGDSVSFRHAPDYRFNLSKLISGAEGTLAVITEIKLNLVPLPQQTALALIHFESLQEALNSVPPMLEVDPSAIELLDNLGLTLCRSVPEYARLLAQFVDGDPNCILITEFYGSNDRELTQKIQHLEDHLKKHKIRFRNVKAMSSSEQTDVWTVRKVGLGLLMSIKGDHKPIPFIEDAAVPPQHLAEYIEKIETFCHSIDTKVAYYAHASAGCLHVRPLINAKVASDVKKLPQIARFSADLVNSYGGALSSEHGDGRTRSWLNERFYGQEMFSLFRQVKGIFDPDNILNPGNIVDTPAMTGHLRYGDQYATRKITEHLDFSSDQGFHRAIEMCNGAGVCRKKTTGTMCPSFMVTREEEHSTRGRANALRAAISGNLPDKELTSERMYEVMDLCIECKACKAECPSSVDMAKIKFEFLAQYHRENGTPLRARLFGNIASLSRLSSGIAAPVSNFFMRRGWLKGLMRLGATRNLPGFAKQSFKTWFRKRSVRNGDSGKQVVLFNDTFNTYNDPHIAIAATEVLEALGYEVLLPGHRCCGRPMISKGLVGPARKAARETVGRLAPFAKAGIPIVGLEPSCLLTLQDEYLYLLPDDENAAVVAEQSLMFEEFISNLSREEDLSKFFSSNPGSILLHGHCHQKALVGTAPSKTTLALPGYLVSEIDSGCCGMAGSFGYEAEHLEISMKMAERRLLPAIRNASEDTLLVAAGTSCRHQIEHGCGRRAYHPAEVLRDALKKD